MCSNDTMGLTFEIFFFVFLVVPLVFDLDTALWFNERYVTTEVAPDEDLETCVPSPICVCACTHTHTHTHVYEYIYYKSHPTRTSHVCPLPIHNICIIHIYIYIHIIIRTDEYICMYVSCTHTHTHSLIYKYRWLEVGSWTWGWNEPVLGTVSFVLLAFQFARNQMVNLGTRPYTESMIAWRSVLPIYMCICMCARAYVHAYSICMCARA